MKSSPILTQIAALLETCQLASCQDSLYRVSIAPGDSPDHGEDTIEMELTPVDDKENEVITLHRWEFPKARLEGMTLFVDSHDGYFPITFLAAKPIAFPVTVDLLYPDYEAEGDQDTFSYQDTYFFSSPEEAAQAEGRFLSSAINYPDEIVRAYAVFRDGVVHSGPLHNAGEADSLLEAQVAAKAESH